MVDCWVTKWCVAFVICYLFIQLFICHGIRPLRKPFCPGILVREPQLNSLFKIPSYFVFVVNIYTFFCEFKIAFLQIEIFDFTNERPIDHPSVSQSVGFRVFFLMIIWRWIFLMTFGRYFMFVKGVSCPQTIRIWSLSH